MSIPPVVLSIAATDSGGGAGLAADLATFAALGVHGTCVVTAVTAQDTLGVHAIHRIPLEVVSAQLDAVLADLRPAAVKTGMLADADVVHLVAERCAGLPLVVDPVLRATTGAVLADEAVVRAYRDHLLPVATVVTPNLAEAATLLDEHEHDDDPARLAVALAAPGRVAVVTGGDSVDGDDGSCVDWMAVSGGAPEPLRHPRLDTDNDHGTGCTFSAAIAALIAPTAQTLLPEHPPKSRADHVLPRHIVDPDRLPWIVRQAAAFTTARLHASSTWDLGRGRGPIAHLIPSSSTHHNGGTR